MTEKNTHNSISEYESNRRDKLNRLRELGIDPYGQRFDNTEAFEKIKQKYDPNNEQQIVTAAGRIVLHRDIGKLIFATMRDWTGNLQIGLSKKLLADKWDAVKLLDLGDIVGVTGMLGRTKTGEITIWATDITLLSKAILPPPEKWHGLQDVEMRYRQRYVDLFANPEVMQTFKLRSDIIRNIRQFLHEKGFMEVETPMMQSIAGGAAAKPFITHHNALNMDLYLRIAPELYLKRLLVGGMERVFEINRNFRNEGISTRHNPEFTMCELYQAYGNYVAMMDIMEELTCYLISNIKQRTDANDNIKTNNTDKGNEQVVEDMKLSYNGQVIDYTRPWARKTYAELFAEFVGCDMGNVDAVRDKARETGLEPDKMADIVLVNELFEHYVEKNLINPTFVIDYPAQLCVLTKQKRSDPSVAERFELFVAGMELANAYTELNDPDVQLANFRNQLKGQEDTEAKMDEDFVTALKYGMPPAGGLGFGIDRLVMLLTDNPSIRDVILFPLLRHTSK